MLPMKMCSPPRNNRHAPVHRQPLKSDLDRTSLWLPFAPPHSLAPNGNGDNWTLSNRILIKAVEKLAILI
ncbi:hypothetical protein E0J16_18000 [Rhizobium pisi]|nr:hypothetical protein E0J16_18000 [Rhizobium pisi]